MDRESHDFVRALLCGRDGCTGSFATVPNYVVLHSWEVEAQPMPLTKKGITVLNAMKKSYGAKKGKRVFYASANAGAIKGVHRKRRRK